MEFFYKNAGNTSGPVSTGDLRVLALRGVVAPDTLLRAGTDGAWVRADQYRRLLQSINGFPPPRTPESPIPERNKRATMTVSEACHIVFNVVAVALQDESHYNRPVSSLKGYDVGQICTALKLLIATEFLHFAQSSLIADEYDAALGDVASRHLEDQEKAVAAKLAEGVRLYDSIPLQIVGDFVRDDQADVASLPECAYDFQDPQFLSQETGSSFAEYCKSLGADDPLYWQKVYARLQLEYTAASPRGNEVQPTECDVDDPGVRDHFFGIVRAFSDAIAPRPPHIGDCSILPYPKKTILYAIRWTMACCDRQREAATDQAIIDRYDRLASTQSYLLTHLARDWHQIEPGDKDAIARLNECEAFPDWALTLKAKYIDEDAALNEALDIAMELAKDRVAFEKNRGGPMVPPGQSECASAPTVNAISNALMGTIVIVLFFLGTFGGLVSGIWLAVLGEWRLVFLGLGFSFVMPYVWPIAAMPAMGLAMVLSRASGSSSGSILATGGRVVCALWNAAIIGGWTLFVFLYFVGHAEKVASVPLLLWGYSTTMTPLVYMARGQSSESTATSFGLMLAVLSYATLLVLFVVGTGWVTMIVSVSILAVLETAAVIASSYERDD